MIALLGVLFQLSHSALFASWLARLWSGGLIVLASKVAYMGWHIGIPAWHFTGISGHAYLASALLSLWLLWAWPNALGWLLTLSGCTLVAISRVALGAHTPSEVILGVMLGLLVGAQAWHAHQRNPVALSLGTIPALPVGLALANPGWFAWLQTYPYELRLSLWLRHLLT